MLVTILGKRWRIRWVPNLGECLGDCDPPNKPNKEIRIWSGCKDEVELDTIIHECLHGSGWHLDEAYVSRFATDLARILTRLGYRKESA
jgi:hypothetical protein